MLLQTTHLFRTSGRGEGQIFIVVSILCKGRHAIFSFHCRVNDAGGSSVESQGSSLPNGVHCNCKVNVWASLGSLYGMVWLCDSKSIAASTWFGEVGWQQKEGGRMPPKWVKAGTKWTSSNSFTALTRTSWSIETITCSKHIYQKQN